MHGIRHQVSPKRVILFTAAAASVDLCLVALHGFDRLMVGSIPHAQASGERLSFATFRPTEMIIVKSRHGDRGIRIREYRFYWSAENRYVDVSSNAETMDYDNKVVPLVTSRMLKPSEANGLDEMVAWFRRRGEERASGVEEYDLTYFRGNEPIGHELFLGYQLPSELSYYARDAAAGRPRPREAYADLAQENGLTRIQLESLFPFENLELRVPTAD